MEGIAGIKYNLGDRVGEGVPQGTVESFTTAGGKDGFIVRYPDCAVIYDLEGRPFFDGGGEPLDNFGQANDETDG